MHRILSLALVGLLALGVSACSTAGPFVTSISSDGAGGLTIEKNTIEFNYFTNTVSSGDNPTTTTIHLGR
jgi:type IV secretion system protein VirB7